MEIINAIDKLKYNQFVSGRKHSRFLQSWEWGEFQRSAGNDVRRLAVADNEGKMLAAATLVKKNLPLGRAYFYCPHVPVIDEARANNQESRTKIFDLLRGEIKKISRDEKVIFFRLEPSCESEAASYKLTKTIDIQPGKTSILDLGAPEEALLRNMRQKTRYNIRLAEKKGVKVREGGESDFEEFRGLMRETRTRDGFRPHPKEYYRRMLRLATGAPGRENELSIKLYLAEYANQALAGMIMVFFGDTATYAHGASAGKDRGMMAPHLLQWRTIQLARKAGYRYYDFYGIDEDKWPGVTRFKRGFGGREIRYPGTYDLVFDKFYYRLYVTARFLRRLF